MSSPVPILRTRKVKLYVPPSKRKGIGQLEAVAEHELRLLTLSHVEASLTERNRLLVFEDGGYRDMSFGEARNTRMLRRDLFRELLEKRLSREGIAIARLRSDTVVAQEMLLTGSAEFFERGEIVASNGERACGVILNENYANWRSRSINFMHDRYGSKLLVCTEHLDEHSPHLTFLVVPLVTRQRLQRWRGHKGQLAGKDETVLSAMSVFDREEHFELHRQYAAALADIGFVPNVGLPGATRTHVSEFYAAIARVQSGAIPSIEALLQFELPAVGRGLIPERSTKYRERAQAALDNRLQEIRDALPSWMYGAVDVQLEHKRHAERKKALQEANMEARRLREENLILHQERRELAERLSKATSPFRLSDLVFHLRLQRGPPSSVEQVELFSAGKFHGVANLADQTFTIYTQQGVVTGTGPIELLVAIPDANVNAIVNSFKEPLRSRATLSLGEWQLRRMRPTKSAVKSAEAYTPAPRPSFSEKVRLPKSGSRDRR
jgi:hypothetical protein